jgi:type II secretory pathway component GspD/PulD (secretin)
MMKVMDASTKAGFATNTHGLKFGFVDKDVTGFIRALETVGETHILAAPRLLVLNKQRAEIQLGRKLGYKTLTVTETSAVEKVEFLNTGTQLRLRPFVSADGTVRMEIHPERSSGFIDENKVPQASTSEVTTNVLIPDGSTIVIGGLMDSEENTEESGVPGLSRLRWVGALFRQKRQSSTKKELIVLLTPHIWNPVGPQEVSSDLVQASLVQTRTQESKPSQRPLRTIETEIHEPTGTTPARPTGTTAIT